MEPANDEFGTARRKKGVTDGEVDSRKRKRKDRKDKKPIVKKLEGRFSDPDILQLPKKTYKNYLTKSPCVM